MRARVIKFGGTSLGTAERIAHAAAAVAAARRDGAAAVVVSAMAGVTDRLARIAAQARADLAAARAALTGVIDDHRAAADALGKGALDEDAADADLWSPDALGRRIADALACLERDEARARDMVLASGEKLSAALLLRALRTRGVAASILAAENLIRTSARHGDAEVDHAATTAAIAARGADWWQSAVRIVPGFTGAGPDGRTTTLGRNASDYSAALVAAGLGWPLEIWTDVAGCYSSDPRHVAGTRLLKRLSHADANRFAHAGASVVHRRTLEPLLDALVPLRIVNSFAPDAESTHIGSKDPERLRGAALRRDVGLLLGAAALAAPAPIDRGRDLDSGAPVAAVAHDANLPLATQPIALVSVFDDEVRAGLDERCRRALADAGLTPLALWWSADAQCVRAALAPADGVAGLRELHRAVLADAAAAPVRLAVIGATGRVGRRLLELVATQAPQLAGRGIDLRLIGVANSRTALITPQELDPATAVESLLAAPAADLESLSHDLLARPERPLVLIDCSASAAVAARYPEWLAAGIDIVTPNKHAPSADAPLVRAIAAAQALSGTHFACETAVGAQLPLLRTLRELAAAGDRVRTVEAILSGTLSYVLARIQRGCAFSAAVREAVDLGYAEPHPASDLSGADAARKLVILLRALGIAVELANIELAPLVDGARLSDADAERLLERLAELDPHWREAVAAAQAAGERWVYRASYADGIARIGPARVPQDHPLARLAPCENVLRLSSDYYCAAPLSIAGPGAGIDLTAAGVYADLLGVAERRAPPRRNPADTVAASSAARVAA